MSTATVSPNISHLPHTAHPIPLREQAFTLHCQGLRSPAIAVELGVSERTIRSWIASSLADLKDDLQLSRKEQLLLAVERQHQLTAAAWQEFERESAARNTLLDASLASLATLGATDASGNFARPPHLPASTPAPRYLSLILQANKEANRLLGLHTLARLQVLTPETTPTPLHSSGPSHAAAGPDHESPAESATEFEIPAKTATAPPLSAHGAARGAASDVAGAERAERAAVGPGVRFHSPAESATAAVAPTPAFRPPLVPAPALQGHDTTHPAESATTTQSPRLSVRSVSSVVKSYIPAESATV